MHDYVASQQVSKAVGTMAQTFNPEKRRSSLWKALPRGGGRRGGLEGRGGGIWCGGCDPNPYFGFPSRQTVAKDNDTSNDTRQYGGRRGDGSCDGGDR
jgi:hypothetical protein